jgi:hypothetical protein
MDLWGPTNILLGFVLFLCLWVCECGWLSLCLLSICVIAGAPILPSLQQSTHSHSVAFTCLVFFCLVADMWTHMVMLHKWSAWMFDAGFCAEAAIRKPLTVHLAMARHSTSISLHEQALLGNLHRHPSCHSCRIYVCGGHKHLITHAQVFNGPH